MFKEFFGGVGGGRNAAASSTVFLSGKEKKTLKIHHNIVPGEAALIRGFSPRTSVVSKGHEVTNVPS